MSVTKHRSVARGAMVAIVLLSAQVSGAALDPAQGIPLAVVNGDTLTSVDLEIELTIMTQGEQPKEAITLPDAEMVLKRMIQNRLLIQEGYRLGLEKRFIVANQVKEIVRAKCVSALLDSVAASIPEDGENTYTVRREGVNNYLHELMETYEVEVDSMLLRSLDFGSKDPEALQAIRNSSEVLAVVPTGNLRVNSFFQVVIFEEFHGLEGRPDAAEVRDQIFENWVFEALVTHQAKVQGIDQQPRFRKLAMEVERGLVGEEALRLLLKQDFDPSDAEIQEFYDDNLELVTPPPEAKLQSAMLNDREAAEKFVKRLKQGAKFNWLVDNTPEVVEGNSPYAAEFHPPRKLGIKPEDAVVGFVPDMYEVPGGGWVVAMVSDVRQLGPLPLEKCRQQLIKIMKQEAIQNNLADIMNKLENEADIEKFANAESIVSDMLATKLSPAAGTGN